MTQENKELLLKDLCARLPYGAKIHYKTAGWEDKNHTLSPQTIDNFLIRRDVVIKPYLRPMSSMTEEEYKEMNELIGWYANIDYLTSIKDLQIWTDPQAEPTIWFGEVVRVQEWLLEKHFDFMGLIPMGLAIEVTKDNNPYKD